MKEGTCLRDLLREPSFLCRVIFSSDVTGTAYKRFRDRYLSWNYQEDSGASIIQTFHKLKINRTPLETCAGVCTRSLFSLGFPTKKKKRKEKKEKKQQ